MAAQAEYDATVASGNSASAALTAAQAQVTALTAQVADLKAQLAAAQNPVPAGFTSYASLKALTDLSATMEQATAVYLPEGQYHWSDFAKGYAPFNSGVLLKNCTSVAGAGKGKTVLSMVPKSSTKGPYVAGLTSKDTNALSYILSDQGDKKTGHDVVWRDLTILGVDEGHLYIGHRTNGAKNLLVQRVEIIAIPGGAGAPPTETFPETCWQVDQATYDTVTVTGIDPVTGKIVSSSLLGINSTNHLEVIGGSYKHSQAMAMALWHTGSARITGAALDDVWRPVNLEQCGAGPFIFDHVDFGTFAGKPGNDAIIQANSYPGAPAGYNVSAKIQIINPKWTPNPKFPGKFCVGVPGHYWGTDAAHVNTQQVADISIVVDGVDRTKDLLQIV